MAHNYISTHSFADDFERAAKAPYRPQQDVSMYYSPYTSVSLPYNPNSNFRPPSVQNSCCSGNGCSSGTYRSDSNQPQPNYSSSNSWFNGN